MKKKLNGKWNYLIIIIFIIILLVDIQLHSISDEAERYSVGKEGTRWYYQPPQNSDNLSTYSEKSRLSSKSKQFETAKECLELFISTKSWEQMFDYTNMFAEKYMATKKKNGSL